MAERPHNTLTELYADQSGMTIQHGNFTIVLHRPNLTKEEREKRERQVLAVLEQTKAVKS